MTESKPPPDGNGRAPQSARPTPPRPADRPAPQPPAGATAVGLAKAGAARPTNGSAAAQPAAPRPSVPGATATPRPPAATARSASNVASAQLARELGRTPQRTAEAYLLQSQANANAAAPDSNPADAKRISPRSPRTAIEPDRVDLPSRRSAGARHPLVVIGNAVISIFVIVAVIAGVALFVGKQRFEQPGPLPQDRVVNIPRGSGMRDIADVLTREGVIDQPWVFIGGVLVLKAREDLKAGEYQFKAHSSLRDVVETMVENRVVTHQLSIPEGLTSAQIVARLMDDDVLVGDIKGIPREGSLLPDTYNFTRGVTREQMIQRMEQAQQRAVREIWDRRSPDLPLKTPDQLVILASLVEKETGKPDERTRVAAVFINRLKQRMRLQSDPTIIYGLVGGKGTLGRPIMRSEIEQPTPYNTYQIDGLPPGPIANPGRASLEAAANPARTRELYFVADGTGGHAFAETYEQHQKNVARLRLIEADQKDQAPLDTQTTPAPAASASPASPPSAPSTAPALRSAPKPRAQNPIR